LFTLRHHHIVGPCHRSEEEKCYRIFPGGGPGGAVRIDSGGGSEQQPSRGGSLSKGTAGAEPSDVKSPRNDLAGGGPHGFW